MSLLNYLQFQPIDSDSDQDEISDDHRVRQEIDLDEQIDENELDQFWSKVEEDIHEDPEWFTFSNQ